VQSNATQTKKSNTLAPSTIAEVVSPRMASTQHCGNKPVLQALQFLTSSAAVVQVVCSAVAITMQLVGSKPNTVQLQCLHHGYSGVLQQMQQMQQSMHARSCFVVTAISPVVPSKSEYYRLT
jgi:hypothetical protein